MNRGAIISACGQYRYRLWRVWDAGLPVLVFVMLNPSTADANCDDPTVRKCMGFAKRLGYGGIVIVNLFAYRATHPKDLKGAGWPIGPENDEHIARVAAAPGSTVVCAWGANARGMSRQGEVLQILRLWSAAPPIALRLTTDGVPWHPLMLPYDCRPTRMPGP